MRFWLLKKLLSWYGEKELDQFDLFKMDSSYGKVYITISRSPLSGSDKNYVELI